MTARNLPMTGRRTTDYTIVELPYGGNPLGAVFILPGSTLEALEATLTGARLLGMAAAQDRPRLTRGSVV